MINNLTFNEIALHYTTVIKVSPSFNTGHAINDKDLLVPKFRQLVEMVLAECKANGINVSPKETYRSNTLQAIYYNSGASKIKSNGMHHYGIAWDMVCLDQNGKALQNGDAKEYIQMRAIADKYGIHLLGLWDAGHFQAVAVAEQNTLRSVVLNYRATEFKGVILQYGVENHYAIALKTALQALKYLPEDYDPQNPFFGASTDEAVRKLQTGNNLSVDGIVGKQTITYLKQKGFDITV